MRGLIALATATLALAGCNDSTAPGNFDPAGTGGKVAQAFGAVQNNRAVHSFDVMSGAFTFAGAAPAFLGAPSVSTAPAAVLPANVLGKTFIYSVQSAKYQPGSDTGAPAAGARFLLYAVDTVSHTVNSPLQQIGYVDLTDKSSAAANTIGVKAIVNNATVVDYDANASIVGATSFTFGAKGNVVDGSNRLDFDISQSLAPSGTIQVSYKLTAPNQGNLGVEVVANASSATSGTSSLTVTDNADQLEIAVTTSGSASNGTAKFNGKDVATVTAVGTADPVFTQAGGQSLTATDLAGLKQLFKSVDLILNRFDDLLFPAYFVYGLTR